MVPLSRPRRGLDRGGTVLWLRITCSRRLAPPSPGACVCKDIVISGPGMNPTCINTYMSHTQMLGNLVAGPCPLLAGRLGGACIAPLLVTPSPRSRKLLLPSPALPSSEPSRNYRIWQAACLITHRTRMGYAYKVGNQVGTPCYMSERFFLTCCFPKASPLAVVRSACPPYPGREIRHSSHHLHRAAVHPRGPGDRSQGAGLCFCQGDYQREGAGRGEGKQVCSVIVSLNG